VQETRTTCSCLGVSKFSKRNMDHHLARGFADTIKTRVLVTDARKASRPSRALVRLRPTPAKRQDRIERSRACGQCQQSVLSARALAADARKASRPPRALARLRPTPARSQDRLERSRGCGRRPQGVKNVSSALTLAADTRKVSSRMEKCLTCVQGWLGSASEPSGLRRPPDGDHLAMLRSHAQRPQSVKTVLRACG
jgi:hypothetical protein